MKEQKVLITHNDSGVQRLLDQGWYIISVTAQHVAIGELSSRLEGNFCFILEKDVNHSPNTRPYTGP